jgi:hypothetical protein
MARAIALTRNTIEAAQARRSELVRSVVVIGCGLALILAGQPAPF